MKQNVSWFSLEKAVHSFFQELDPSIYYLQLVKEHWNVILGYPVCEKIEPYYWKKNILIVSVTDASYTNYIMLRSETIASQIRAVLKNDYCRGVKAEQRKLN